MSQTTKKRHHYIPEAYLYKFQVSDANPKVYVYQKHEALPPRLGTPKNLAVESYYYAFDKEDGRDTNSIEDMFSMVESLYPGIVEKIVKQEIFYPQDIDNLATFIALMRVRVPNFRLQYEAGHAEAVKTHGMIFARHDKEFQQMHKEHLAKAKASGDYKSIDALNKIKEELELGKLNVSINPQISLIGIDLFRKIHSRLKDLKWGFFTSDCDQDFITSDNPTLWHDTSIKEFYPYKNGIESPHVQFVFPLTKNVIVLANTFFKERVSYGSLPKKWVYTYNHAIAKSAERYIFASQDHLGRMIGKYRNIVPTLEHARIKEGTGYNHIMRHSLGKPHKLPTWKNK